MHKFKPFIPAITSYRLTFCNHFLQHDCTDGCENHTTKREKLVIRDKTVCYNFYSIIAIIVKLTSDSMLIVNFRLPVNGSNP